ncbi:hypothetical protein K1719_034718 [Acacia pycnantha]|nr:hypothetical protein K1719_034718 [Acacia pycnantha]
MASRADSTEDCETKGSMWVLDQKLDQSMDEEAGRLRNMYKEKINQSDTDKPPCFLNFHICGVGETFALYSLLCRHAKIKTIPNQHRTDEELTTYSRSAIHEKSFAAKTHRWLEEKAFRKNAILILVLVGTCMVIGEGILTPAISDFGTKDAYSKEEINLVRNLLVGHLQHIDD